MKGGSHPAEATSRPADEQSLTLRQGAAAKLVGVTTRTIRNYVKDGRLKQTNVGRTPFYKRSDVEALIGL